VNSVLRISLATLSVVASPGCSLIFTRGPQPEVHPAPECTASVAAPVVDTVLATASVTLLGLGVGAASTSCTGGSGPYPDFCGSVQQGGWGAVVVGAAMGALFITSAVVGYQRTSACRSSLEPNAMLPQPRASLLPASPAEACAPVGDAPRTCPRAVPISDEVHFDPTRGALHPRCHST
jgi:hypothetical protein